MEFFKWIATSAVVLFGGFFGVHSAPAALPPASFEEQSPQLVDYDSYRDEENNDAPAVTSVLGAPSSSSPTTSAKHDPNTVVVPAAIPVRQEIPSGSCKVGDTYFPEGTTQPRCMWKVKKGLPGRFVDPNDLILRENVLSCPDGSFVAHLWDVGTITCVSGRWKSIGGDA